jgi:hypothetical protein
MTLTSLELTYFNGIIICFPHEFGSHEWDKDRQLFKSTFFNLRGQILFGLLQQGEGSDRLPPSNPGMTHPAVA